MRQLGDRRRLAHAIHANDEDDVGDAALEDLDAAVADRLLQQADHVGAQDLLRLGGLPHAALADLRAQLVHQLVGRVGADVGTDQQRLEIIEEILIDLAALEEFDHLLEDAAPRLLQALFQLLVALPAPEKLHDHSESPPG